METKKLLEEIVKDRLEKATNGSMSDDEKRVAFEEAMKATDRLVEVTKVETTDEKKFDRVIKYIEMFIIPAALMLVDFLFKMRYTKTVCNFEKDYTFTTTPGRGVSQLFRFKK